MNSPRRRNSTNATQHAIMKFKLSRSVAVISKGFSRSVTRQLDSFVMVSREIGFLTRAFVIVLRLLAASIRRRNGMLIIEEVIFKAVINTVGSESS